MEDDVLDYNVKKIISKKCNPIANGSEVRDGVVDIILTFEKTDTNGDGIKRMVSQVVMCYYGCDGCSNWKYFQRIGFMLPFMVLRGVSTLLSKCENIPPLSTE